LGRPGDLHLGAAHTGTPSRLPTGLAVLDTILEGGLPRGRVTELVGARSTGRTGLACAIAAGATGVGEVIAWIDSHDTFDPESVARTGVVLARMLWVRPRQPTDAFRAADLLLAAGGFGLVVLDVPDSAATHPPPWRRLSRTAERTGTVLLVLATGHCTGAVAALGLEITARHACWSGGAGRLTLLDGVAGTVHVVRSRVGRPGGSLDLRSTCA
jgi:hypothetical protein